MMCISSTYTFTDMLQFRPCIIIIRQMDWLRRVKSVLYKWEVVEFKAIFSYVVSSKPRHETGCLKCLKQKLKRETTIN